MSRRATPPSSEEVVTVSKRDPVLDGCRALAIVLVVVHHVRVRMGDSVSPLFPFTGLTGVALFFILSGFLITSLLLDERSVAGTISLRKFYARRALRIFPAFYAFLLVATVGRSLGFWNFSNRDLLSSATYWQNLVKDPALALQHTWSLAVEEQFYLLWPLAVAMFGPRWLTIVALAVIFGQPVARGVLKGVTFYQDGEVALNSAGMETILVGALAALILHRPSLAGALRRLLANTVAPVANLIGLFVLYLVAPKIHGPATLVLPYARNLFLALFLVSTYLGQSFIVSRLMRAEPLRLIGLMSYSLYLWQQLFLVALSVDQLGTVPALCLTLLAATLSYRFIERPFLHLRHVFGLGRPSHVTPP